jgi:hypothetical protein
MNLSELPTQPLGSTLRFHVWLATLALSLGLCVLAVGLSFGTNLHTLIPSFSLTLLFGLAAGFGFFRAFRHRPLSLETEERLLHWTHRHWGQKVAGFFDDVEEVWTASFATRQTQRFRVGLRLRGHTYLIGPEHSRESSARPLAQSLSQQLGCPVGPTRSHSRQIAEVWMGSLTILLATLMILVISWHSIRRGIAERLTLDARLAAESRDPKSGLVQQAWAQDEKRRQTYRDFSLIWPEGFTVIEERPWLTATKGGVQLTVFFSHFSPPDGNYYLEDFQAVLKGSPFERHQFIGPSRNGRSRGYSVYPQRVGEQMGILTRIREPNAGYRILFLPFKKGTFCAALYYVGAQQESIISANYDDWFWRMRPDRI